MNILDIIIGIVLIIFAFSGLRKGLIMEAFSLASYVIGIYGALFFSETVSNWLADAINVTPEYLTLVAFILTFIVVVILVRYLGRLISAIVEAIHLGFVDKIGGFFFGILKGALLLSIFIMVLNVFGVGDVINKDLRKNSFLYTQTENIANILYSNQELVKDSMRRNFNKGKDIIDDGFDKLEDVIETSLTK